MADYIPISCELHDVLEAAATTRRLESIRFLDEHGAVRERTTSIVDVFSRGGVEYVVLGTGEPLRLDRLATVGGTLFMEAAGQPAGGN